MTDHWFTRRTLYNPQQECWEIWDGLHPLVRYTFRYANKTHQFSLVKHFDYQPATDDYRSEEAVLIGVAIDATTFQKTVAELREEAEALSIEENLDPFLALVDTCKNYALSWMDLGAAFNLRNQAALNSPPPGMSASW
ncbi:MAG: hypothetical protein HC915_15215 [Anaerolineae bacterium]|nr:hypothetical protein [Anaerolineae bacterium]